MITVGFMVASLADAGRLSSNHSRRSFRDASDAALANRIGGGNASGNSGFRQRHLPPPLAGSIVKRTEEPRTTDEKDECHETCRTLLELSRAPVLCRLAPGPAVRAAPGQGAG